jgi:signal transduction histidine kinase
MLSEAEKALARARKLTDRLMTVVRGESLPSMQVVDLRSVFEETGRMMTRRPNLEMKFRWSSEPMKVMGDEGLLNQVAANLLVNAVQAVPKDRGMISIDGEVVANRGGDPGMPAGMAKGMWMRIKVQDNGPGISPDAASKIFDPFFTTKDKGTGLGLAMVRRIVEVHGGKVSAQSIPNFGTTFVLWLPSIVDDAASRRSEQTESP